MYAVIYTLIGFTIIAINLIVIYQYCWKRRNLLHTPSNRFLLSLSICDFLNGFSVILTAVTSVYPSLQHPSTTSAYVYRILVDVYTTFLVKTAVMHLCGIALDRYLMTYNALKYRTLVTQNSIKCSIVVVWSIPFFFSSIQFAWLYKVIEGSGPNNNDIKMVKNIEIWYSVVSFIIFLTAPLISLAVAYLAILLEIRRLIRCTPGGHSTTDSLPKQRRAIHIFCSMYLAFVVSAMPYFTLRLWIDIRSWINDSNISIVSKPMWEIITILKNLTSIANPILYSTAARFTVEGLLDAIRKISAATYRKISSYQTNVTQI